MSTPKAKSATSTRVPHTKMPKVDKSIVRFKHGRKQDRNLLGKTLGALGVLFCLGMYVCFFEQPQRGWHFDVPTFTQAETPSVQLPVSTYAVVIERAPLKMLPELGAQIVAVLEAGDEVELLSQTSGWVQAKSADYQGWLPTAVLFGKEDFVR